MDYAEVVLEHTTEAAVVSSWLSGSLNAVAWHDPGKYPKRHTELLSRKEEPKPWTKEQWAAMIAHLTKG